MIDYAEVLYRIKKIYSEVSDEEKDILKTILLEINETGSSKTYEELWLADYKEIPVDKQTFLTDPRFLGSTNDEGKAIYPVWMDTMLELEATGNQYYEIVFTGATRTGKSSTAVSDACYLLYKVMCLRNPQSYFGLKEVTEIQFFFFNLTERLAKGVAFKEFNNTLRLSPWFVEHGSFTDSKENPVYIPEGGLIKIKYGSDSSHALGQATICVVGDTEILTSNGVEKIENLVDSNVSVAQYSDEGELIYSTAKVVETKKVTETIRITLEDGSVLEGTPDHPILLVDGTYKNLGDLTESDDIQTF